MHVLPTKMREFGHRSFSKDRVPLRPFRNRKLKNELFSSPLQSSTILSLMRIPHSLKTGKNRSSFDGAWAQGYSLYDKVFILGGLPLDCAW